MLEVVETDDFNEWLRALRDVAAKGRIIKQVQRVQLAEQYVGDWKAVGNGVIEMRLMFGPGYRLYTSIQGRKVLLLLIGGDKSTQESDIEKAAELLDEWKQAERESNAEKGGSNDDIQGI